MFYRGIFIIDGLIFVYTNFRFGLISYHILNFVKKNKQSKTLIKIAQKHNHSADKDEIYHFIGFT